MVRIGFFSRGFGTFGTPVQLGIISLMSWTYLVSNYFLKGKRKIILTLLVFIVGLSSLSKTFIIGVPLIFMLIILFSFWKKGFLRKGVLIFLLLLLIGSCVYYILEGLGTYASHYFEYLLKPIEAFDSRYINPKGLGLTYEVISENLLTGVGFGSVKGEFMGDSLYVKIFHNGGIIALLILVVFLIYTTWFLLKKGELTRFIIFVAILLGGFAQPTLFSSEIVIPFLFYIFLMNKQLKHEE
jgi:hypothetical protein